ncbi:MAG TPA: glycine cleavage system aminomethyltransferase GcvT [Chloroflexi bacterium]|nr:glycine cleavage system aminomethyltransferase GcvT [Chloroflexota bacterium]
MSIDFIFRETAEELDPELSQLVSLEDRRQQEKIILIPSASIAPSAVRYLMSSNFGNIYAEGYPKQESRELTESEILDFDAELAYFRRYSDPRYYKGVEYADILEALARRRAAKLFAANGLKPGELFVNVQPLSGSPANSAVYTALLQPGDTIMGLDLRHGGHLTHGSKISRSGKIYNSVPYELDLESEQLDYDAIEEQAMEVRPQLIIAGFTAYPLLVDWHRFRQIADKCGAYLVADIAHISGLVAAGVHPSPIGIADVVTTTTHKSLCGPRGAMILTHRPNIADRIDRAVFPGEQGGPHLNTIAALALALKLAGTSQFRRLMQRVVYNASRLAQKLADQDIRIVSGGSENHLLLMDMKSITLDGVHLSGDMAARILDVAGIVTNRNTVPGDQSAFRATGVRLGTVWISQLGYGDQEIDLLAQAIAKVLKGCQPYTYSRIGGRKLLRAKVDPSALQESRAIVNELTHSQGREGKGEYIEVRNPDAPQFLHYALASDVRSLAVGNGQKTKVFGYDFQIQGELYRKTPDRYLLHFDSPEITSKVSKWLNDLSDGYIFFGDLYAKLPGPIVAKQINIDDPLPEINDSNKMVVEAKPFYIGLQSGSLDNQGLPDFSWIDQEVAPLKSTQLHDTHINIGARMVPFGGWDMPVWYSSVSEEHAAVRETAGLFDVSHMGVLEVSGPNATTFLNYLTTNDVNMLKVGQSQYSYLLFPNSEVVDDLFIYRRGPENFMLVVNASNNDKDWAWINAVNQGDVLIDENRPWSKILHPATLRDLRDPKWGADCRVDIALQGPRSTDILLSICGDPSLAERIKALEWAQLTEGSLSGYDIVISRTGYTGERVAYELFVHPEQSPAFWQTLLDAGKVYGLIPCGLASRDSTRTEAGLPLYGHELAGPLNLSPAEAGFDSYVKLWKPFFIGRYAYINRRNNRDKVVIRFRMDEKGVRRPELGDPVLDRRGKIIGTVTSCAIDANGYLLGQAVVPTGMSTPGTSILIYQLGGGTRTMRFPAEMKEGSRLPIPDRATILTRFPVKNK